MKFSYKILLCTIIVMAVGFGCSGYFFVNHVFSGSLKREIGQAQDESSILRFAFETAALNTPSKYNVLQDTVVKEIAVKLESSGQEGRKLLRLSDEDRISLYASEGFIEDTQFLAGIAQETVSYRIIPWNDSYYVQTGLNIKVLDRVLYLETLKDVTGVFNERNLGFSIYRKVTVLMLLISSVIMYFVAYWLTKPIRLLTRATHKMALGEYTFRAERFSNDELGQLTLDFNRMANVLEDNIHTLEDEVRAREDFVAAFAHELKTPLTAIIGYADLLRSRKLDAEKHFLSANYIYTEGKRLETMSFRLLDIIVTKRNELVLQKNSAEDLFEYIKDMYRTNTKMQFHITYDKGLILAEISLIKTVLLNLIDNACKASSDGSVIEVTGVNKTEGYYITVKDHGVGIAADEQRKLRKHSIW